MIRAAIVAEPGMKMDEFKVDVTKHALLGSCVVVVKNSVAVRGRCAQG